jgi:hypothetical protein
MPLSKIGKNADVYMKFNENLMGSIRKENKKSR